MTKIEEKVIEKTSDKKISTRKPNIKKVEKASDDVKKVEVKKASLNKVEIKNATDSTKKDKNNIDSLGRAYATGKRKNAIAKVWLKKGSGNIIINGISATEYLKRPLLDIVINTPFVVTDTVEKFDVVCTALGGGLSGQAGAIRHGIAKALQIYNSIYRAELKSAGLLTRDSRVVERKKAGLIKARKGQVYKRR